MMSMTWKSGVKSQAIRLSGSVGVAGCSGGIGVGVGTTPEASGVPPGAQAAMTTATSTKNMSAGPIRRTVGDRITRIASLANRVIPARIPRVTPGDALGAHPAPLQQPVLRDRLLRVVRTGRLVSTRWRQPGEHDPVELDEPDPD